MTEYGGSVPHEKHLCGDLSHAYKYCQPYLKNLWIGYPFSYEYNRARGHTYALHDVGDIKKVVPPIKKHSRKLQQSQKHLDSHPWFSYIPFLPEADLVWDINKRLMPKPN